MERDRGTAAGIAVGIWLLLVLIYDMALLGLLVVDQGQMLSAGAVSALLLLNPTDVYRMLTLASFANVSVFSGMAGLAGWTGISPALLLTALGLWRSCRWPLPFWPFRGENYETGRDRFPGHFRPCWLREEQATAPPLNSPPPPSAATAA
jgi:hypothetical protein